VIICDVLNWNKTDIRIFKWRVLWRSVTATDFTEYLNQRLFKQWLTIDDNTK
jgi:hypothetical protein